MKPAKDKCDSCGGPVTDWRMLCPDIWSVVAPGVVRNKSHHKAGCADRCQCGLLCTPCIEQKIGRELIDEDYD